MNKEEISFKSAAQSADNSQVEKDQFHYEGGHSNPRRVSEKITIGFLKWFKNNKSQWVPQAEYKTVPGINNNIRLVVNNERMLVDPNEDYAEKDTILKKSSESFLKRTLSDSLVLSSRYEIRQSKLLSKFI